MKHQKRRPTEKGARGSVAEVVLLKMIARILAAGAVLVAATSNQVRAEEPSGQTVRPLMTDNFSIEIDRDADFVWEQIKRLYIEGDRYRQDEGSIAPLTADPEAYLGGYKTVRESEDGRVMDGSAFRFSRIDEENRFIAMSIDTASNGKVIVTHEVRPRGDTSVYCVVIHAFLNVDLESGVAPTAQAVREEMVKRLAEHHAGVAEIWREQKAMIEAAQ